MADVLQTGTTGVCGCCSGVAVEAPQPLFNRPGLSAIAYRVATHQQFKDTLLARLRSSHQLALNGLRTREDDDFTIALLDAFSVMGDVLTFYGERIANEAYLRTATERLSVRELAELIGYQLRPGVAASTVLAFTVEETAAAFGTVLVAPTISQVIPQAPPTVTIDVGTKIQSVPGPGETPQTYETVEKIVAKGTWNAISPRLVRAQEVTVSAKSVLLRGSLTTIKKGDTVLLLGKTGEQALKRIFATYIDPGPKSVPAPGTDLSTTEFDFEDVAKQPTYQPAPEVLSQDTGDASKVPLDTLLTSENVKQYVLSKTWDADVLLALVETQKWNLDQLQTLINDIVDQTTMPVGEVLVFRQIANPFGYNAPRWDSLPANMRYASNPLDVPRTVQPAYPHNWENFTLRHGQAETGNKKRIYLDKTYPEVVPGSWISLHALVGDKEHWLNAKVTSNTEVPHSDFTLSAKVSLLEIETSHHLHHFPIRETTIYCQSEALTVAPIPIPEDIQDKVLKLDRAYLGLQSGRKVVISGQRSDASSVSVAEVRTLTKVTLEAGYTVITLDSSLDYQYQRSTVSINANVADCTNGETVKEILGSGDGTQTFQKFVLKQSPLTYVTASTPSGTATTLEVRVNDLLWKEVPFFFGHGPEEHIYITRQDDSGTTIVMFGDGQTGSRLPTGQQNVVAKYRRGIGSGGLVRANQLSIMASRPLGVRGATNPLAATGADDPEKIEDARQNATLTIMALDRVVSLEDYQDFARAFAGIAKSFATWTWNGESQVVLLTVAGVNGAKVLPGDDLYRNLRDAIAKSSEPWVSVQLSSYTPTFFRISGTVMVKPEYLVSQVATKVEAALRATFSFATRGFGQPVHRSEVIAAIQSVEGVEFVDLDAFYAGSTPTLEDDIVAAVPRTGKNEFFPAQLLTIDPGPLGLEVTQ